MTRLRDGVDEYIALRRSLGFKLRDMAPDLRDFAAFLEQHAAPFITSALAVAWAMQPVDHQPSDWAQRLGFVRVFARYWSATDPRTEIPAAGLLPFRPQRARPYLYTDEEIRQLLAATKALLSRNGLRPCTYRCLFGLLVVSGMRISEAIALERRDVDLHDGLLTIRKAKFNKTRLIPLHASTRERVPRLSDTTARPLPVGRGANRLATVGDDRPPPRGCRARHRRPCALRRQGAQGALHAPHQAGRAGAQNVVPGAEARPQRDGISERERNHAQC